MNPDRHRPRRLRALRIQFIASLLFLAAVVIVAVAIPLGRGFVGGRSGHVISRTYDPVAFYSAVAIWPGIGACLGFLSWRKYRRQCAHKYWS